MSDPRDGGPPEDGAGPDGDPTAGAPGGAEVGSVGEEAAKLLGALSDWAKDSGGDLGSGLGTGLGQSLRGLAGQAASTMSGISAHIDTGAPECTYCPICRTVHVIRTTSPEVKAHLASAASSFLQALVGVLATLPPPQGAGSGSDFERIDLDADDDGPTDGPTEEKQP
ncbi:hypothetical protein BH11ACT8_BH11ACT8_06510 [soil metagenome]